MKLSKIIAASLCALTFNACGSAENINEFGAEPDMRLGESEEALQLKGCSKTISQELVAGFSNHCFAHGGLNRAVRIYVPASRRAERAPAALVVVLHGGGGSGLRSSDSDESALGTFTKIADRKNFIVVYPTATQDKTGKNGWNDCRTDDLVKSGADDSAFLAELIRQMSGNLNIPNTKVFMSGHSNGAMMSFRFAMEHGNLIGGIATASGNIAKKPKSGACSLGPSSPVPVLMTHGTNDRIVPFEGGCVANILGIRACKRGNVVSVSETVDFWLKANGIENRRPVLRRVDLDKNDSGVAIEASYGQGRRTVKVWRLEGAGHQIPSMSVSSGDSALSKRNRDIEFAFEAWKFFESMM